MVPCRCRLQETTVQVDSDRGVFLSTLPATGRDRTVALCGCRRLVGSVCVRRALCRHAACPDSGFRCELPIRARGQRSDHRRPAVFAVRYLAVAGAAAACERLSVHRGRGDRARPDLSRPVRAGRAVQCRFADHRLALHGLARRISARGARLCAVEGQAMAAPRYEARPAEPSSGASSRSALRYRPWSGSSPASTTCCRRC